MTSNQPPKETVIIVHGTFAAPKDGETQWYQLGHTPSSSGSFVQQLDKELEKAGSSARCWAHCNDPSEIFSWSGENSWDARYNASIELLDYIKKIIRNDWQVHLVAHSHGGNVVIDAIDILLKNKDSFSNIKSIVSLGTPFLNHNEAVNLNLTNYYLKFLIYYKNSVSIYMILCFIAGLFFVLGFTIDERLLQSWPFLRLQDVINLDFDTLYQTNMPLNGFVPSFFSSTVISLLIVIVPYIFFVNYLKTFLREYSQKKFKQISELVTILNSTVTSNKIPTLCINCVDDEAWLLLNHISRFAEPASSDTSLVTHVMRHMKKSLKRKKLKYDIMGAEVADSLIIRVLIIFFLNGLFLDLCCLIFLTYIFDELTIFILFLLAYIFAKYLNHIYGIHDFTPYASKFMEGHRYKVMLIEVLREFPQTIVSYYLKTYSRNYLVSYIYGTHDYLNYSLQVSQTPKNISCIYEEISVLAHDCALQKRKVWLSNFYNKAENIFKQVALTNKEINEFIKSIECDQSLVHSVYYTNSGCIHRLSLWINDAQA